MTKKKKLVKLDSMTAVNPDTVIALKLEDDLKVKVFFTYAGIVRLSETMASLSEALGFVQLNSKESVNPKLISSVVVDDTLKTRVFLVTGGAVISDYGFLETVERIHGETTV